MCNDIVFSIEIESLTGYYFPVRGININRCWCTIFAINTLAEGLISIEMLYAKLILEFIQDCCIFFFKRSLLVMCFLAANIVGNRFQLRWCI